ncbi:hypothetical protein PSW73_23395, partial [Shigella flexneri]|nr:hypothetical protein [Shigella flexneri]
MSDVFEARHIALQTLHMASFKYIAHQPVRFTQTEAVIGIYGDDADNCFRLRKANGLVSDVFEARH